MGFLQQDTNNIIVDAVLTDEGRRQLAQGTFSVTKFAAGDDEVDYGMIVRYGRTVGQEKIEKNTPVFEAITNSSKALVHPLVSVSDPNLYVLPTVTLTPVTSNTLSLGTSTSQNHSDVTVRQTISVGTTIPTELIDNNFMVVCDDRFLTIGGATPTIDRNRIATYTLSATSTSSTGAVLIFTVTVKSITEAQWHIYGQPTDKRNIRTVMKVTGYNSGTVSEFVVSITQSTTA